MDLDRFDLSHADTVEQMRPGISETGIFKATQRIDMDLDYLSDDAPSQSDTIKVPGACSDADEFSADVFPLASVGDTRQC